METSFVSKDVKPMVQVDGQLQLTGIKVYNRKCFERERKDEFRSMKQVVDRKVSQVWITFVFVLFCCIVGGCKI